jgi:hypothetical protein
MTRDEILNMPAGRELDALIAERIFGLKDGGTHWVNSEGKPTFLKVWDSEWLSEPFYPSEDIDFAWYVVEKMQVHGFNTRVEVQSQTVCSMWVKNLNIRGPEPVTARAETAPLAICRAALLAVMK